MTISYESKANIRRNTRIILGAAFVLAVIFAVNGLFSAYLLRQNSIRNYSDRLSNLTLVLAEHTKQTVFSANTALDSIMDVIRLEKIKNEKGYRDFASKKSQYDLLRFKTESNPVIDVATFVGDDGKVLNFTRSYPAPDINLADRDYFKYLSANDDSSTFYSVPVRNKGNGKWVFYLARRVNGESGQFLGVVLVGISVEVFSSMYEKVGKNLGEGAAVTLYRKDKTLLTRWPLVSEMLGKVNTNNFIDRSLANASINNGIIFASGAGFSRANETPVERMISYRAVEGYPFVVGAVVPEAIYLAGWYQNVFGVLLATTLSLIALFSGTYFFVTTYRKSAEHQYRAHHDVLTELPNRFLFSDRLQTTIAASKRSKEKFVLLFVDLDNLKTINDVHSHTAGDFLLKEVATRMKSILRESDTIARLGGDEFVVILPGLGDESDALRVAEKIRQALLQPIEFEGHSLNTSASIGVAIYPIHGENESDLMNAADVAMYEAKAAGRNALKVYGASTMNSVVGTLL